MFHSLWTQGPGLGQVSQKPGPGAVPQASGSSTSSWITEQCFPRHILQGVGFKKNGTDKTRNRYHMECQHSRQQLNPLHRNANLNFFFHDCLDVYIEVDNQRTPKIKLELTKGKRVKNYFNTFVQCHYIWNQF